MARKLAPVRLAVHLPLKFRCDEDWRAMAPVAGGRACGACDRVVHDLSAMTEREAARFMAERRGTGVCLRYEANEDGAVIYRPEPSRLAPALMAAALAACTPHEPPPQIANEVEVVEVATPVPVAVVVPEVAVVEPPDDDINPCAPDPIGEPGAAKKTPKPKPRPKEGPGQAAAKEKIEYLGFM